MADPTLCRTGCGSWECNQGRNLPCPHRAADVAAMREMGIDLQPIERKAVQSECPESHWRTVDALLAVGLVAACAAFFVFGA